MVNVKVLSIFFITLFICFIGLVVWKLKKPLYTSQNIHIILNNISEKGLSFTYQYEHIETFNKRPGTGLGKDIDIYMKTLDPVEYINSNHIALVLKQRNIVISLEHINSNYKYPAYINVFIPNQELVSIDDEQLLLKSDIVQYVLCKNIYSRQIFNKFKEKYNCTWDVHFFEYPATLTTRFFNEPKDRTVYLHPAGKSWMKHTAKVIQAWLKNPHWPQLIVTCADDCRKIHLKTLQRARCATNISIYSFLNTLDMQFLQKHAGVVILPSACEGFGHSVYEAMENGNLLISSDIPPLNENLIDGENSLLIPPSSSEAIGNPNGKFKWTHKLSSCAGNAGSFCFDISVDNIEVTVNRSIYLTSDEYYEIRLNAVRKVHEMSNNGHVSMKLAFRNLGLQVS